MFIFNGIKSSDMMVSCENEDFIGRAPFSYEEHLISGRDGSEFEILNYQNYEKNITMIARDPLKIDEIKNWLKGKGIFIYNNRKTFAFFLDELDPESLMDKAYKFKTTFIRHPFWYSINDEYARVTNEIINQGNATCKPIIKLVGTGSVDITINDVRFIYNFDEDKEVEIDCHEMSETYNGISKSKNIEIGFKYPSLIPGTNKVQIHSGVGLEIYIKRKDAWL